jgi:hypothetical protein
MRDDRVYLWHILECLDAICTHAAEGRAVVRFRGTFAYVDAYPLRHQFMRGTTLEEQAQIEATPTHLCRLGYIGKADLWVFAFFKYSDEKYEPSFLPSGASMGTAEEACDCAAQVYLQD